MQLTKFDLTIYVQKNNIDSRTKDNASFPARQGPADEAESAPGVPSQVPQQQGDLKHGVTPREGRGAVVRFSLADDTNARPPPETRRPGAQPTHATARRLVRTRRPPDAKERS